MAVSTDVTDGQSESGKGMTHTEKVAQENPEAVKAVADRAGGDLGVYLERVLEETAE